MHVNDRWLGFIALNIVRDVDEGRQPPFAISARVSVLRDPKFLELVDFLREADCTHGNCEAPLLDHWCGRPTAKGIFDLPLFSDPLLANEFAWLGFTIMSLANNHVMDYGTEGLASTLAHLHRVGIGSAGAGLTLGEAAQPIYYETSGGRVGLVSCATSFPKWTMAAEARCDANGRPGVNGIRLDRSYRVDPAVVAQLRTFLHQFLEATGESLSSSDSSEDYVLISRALNACGWTNIEFAPGAPGESVRLISSVRDKDSQRL